jgi:hypothetical protein
VNTAGTHNVLQDILTRLRTFYGEWFLDNTLGVPWFQTILRKGTSRADIVGILQDVILTTPGVQRLDVFDAQFDTAARAITVRFSCSTVRGRVDYTGTVISTTGSA